MYFFIDDFEAVRALKDGNMQALEYFYARYQKPVYHFLKTYCRDHELAEEATQDAFLKLWDTKHKVNELLNIKNLLFTIVKNRIIDQMRKISAQEKALKIHYVSRPESFSTLDQVIFSDYKRVLSTVMLKLPLRSREVFNLSRTAQLSNVEISKQLNISVKAVEKHITKSLQFLTLYLKSQQILLVLTFIKLFLK